MIGFLRGVLAVKTPPSLIIETHGVGYEVDAPLSTFEALPALGETVLLYTHLVVREDAHILYGFAAPAERALFRTLIRISGVGPRLALTLLSGFSVQEFSRCVYSGDIAALVRLPGVGRKTAERLVVELRDRLPELPQLLPTEGHSVPPAMPPEPQDEAVSALVALGFKPLEATRLVGEVDSAGKRSEEIIRLALRRAAT